MNFKYSNVNYKLRLRQLETEEKSMRVLLKATKNAFGTNAGMKAKGLIVTDARQEIISPASRENGRKSSLTVAKVLKAGMK